MALSSPFDKKGLITVIKCRTRQAYSFVLQYICCHQITLSGERALFNLASQFCHCFEEVWILNPASRPQPIFHLNGAIVLTDRVNSAKGRGEMFFLVIIRSLKMILTQIISAGSLCICREKTIQKIHLISLL